MASLREIKSRIRSIKNTRQITKAMQMVSASKMKKAQERAINTNPYADGLFEVLSHIENLERYKSVYTRKVKQIKKILIVLIGQSRGFVGGQVTSLFLNTHKNIEELKNLYGNIEFIGISIQKMGLKILNNLKIKSIYHFSQEYENANTTILAPIYKVIQDGFRKKEYDCVYLSYMKFINMMNIVPEFKKLLPITLTKEEKQKGKKDLVESFKFEPSADKVFKFIIPEYFETQILNAIFNAKASEHSARMIAMKSATDNANELIEGLNLEFNKSRQSEITQEILELSMGSIT